MAAFVDSEVVVTEVLVSAAQMVVKVGKELVEVAAAAVVVAAVEAAADMEAASGQ